MWLMVRACALLANFLVMMMVDAVKTAVIVLRVTSKA